jgi:hypothetical protein
MGKALGGDVKVQASAKSTEDGLWVTDQTHNP